MLTRREALFGTMTGAATAALLTAVAATPANAAQPPLADVGKPFAGTTLKLATESTPPSNAIATQLKQYFEEASGIKIEIEVLPLEQVLQS